MIEKIADPNEADQRSAVEEMSLNAWPALRIMHYRGSVLRFSEGYTKRSNSVNLLNFQGDFEELIHTAEKEYAKRGLPTIFKIVHAEKHLELDAALDARGYAVKDPTTVRTLDLLRNNFPIHGRVALEKGIPQKWMDQFVHANHLEKKGGTVEALLNHIPVDTISAAIWDTDSNHALGFGFGALEGDYVGCFDIFVRQEARGLGYGKAIMESLLGAAHAAGAVRAYLQVMDDNTVAKGLYDSLDFKPLYSYHYRIKEGNRPSS